MLRAALALLLVPAFACAQHPGGGSAPAERSEPWFTDVTLEAGLEPGSAGRNVFADLDGDGWMDIVVDQRRVYRNVPGPRGGRRFARLEGGLTDDGARPDVTLYADLDDDGDQDAFVGFTLDPSKPGFVDPGRRSHVRLIDHAKVARPIEGAPVTSSVAFVGSTVSPTEFPPEALVCAAALDADRDGLLDLVTAGNYREGGGPLEAYPVRLWRGLGQGRFEDITERAGLALRPEAGRVDSRRPVYGLTAADVTGDGWADILVCAYGRQRNILWVNQGLEGTPRFVDAGMASGFAGDEDTSGRYTEETRRMFRERYNQERADEAPFRSNGNTFDAAVADYDRDGDWDVFLAEITHSWAGPSSDRSALLENLGGEGPLFERHPDAMPRVHATSNWNQGDLYSGWLDADGDGLEDLLIASGDYPDEQRLRLFHQGPVGTFTDVTAAAGIDVLNAAQLSVADYDRDGDLDILCGLTNTRFSAEQAAGRALRPVLLENRRANARGWLALRLEGRGATSGGANRDAVGAIVEVTTTGGVTQRRQVQCGRGHAGHDDGRALHVGLGDARRIERLVITWPDREGSATVLEDLRANRLLRIRQPARGEAAKVTDLGPF